MDDGQLVVVDEANWTEWISSPEQDTAIGTSIFFFSSLSFLMYLLVLWALCCRTSFNRNPCYQIMLSLAVSDCISLICWMFIAVHVASRGRLVNGELLTAVLLVNMIGWRNMGWHQALLAYNRYVIICRPKQHEKSFRRRKLAWMLTFCWLQSLVFALPSYVPPAIAFEPNGYFVYFPHPQVALYYIIEDEAVTAILILVAVVCYVLVLRKYRQSRVRVASRTNGAVSTDFAEQMRLAWQMLALSCLYTISGVSFYMVQYVTMGVWPTFVLSSVFWMINNAVSPFIYLSFNRKMQREFKECITQFWSGAPLLVSGSPGSVQLPGRV